MELKIKICGITNLADARYAAAAGADFLGFIRQPDSPRFLEAKSAAELIEWIIGPLCVGVFVNTSPDEINEDVERANFDLIQLHGEESVDVCRKIERPIIKAFRVREDDTVTTMQKRMEPYRGAVEYFLLDAYHPVQYGGTGSIIDWSLASTLAAEFPLMLAGGLTPENVASAVQVVQPAGIDLSSGVESAPGEKDFEKLDALFDVVRIEDLEGNSR